MLMQQKRVWQFDNGRGSERNGEKLKRHRIKKKKKTWESERERAWAWVEANECECDSIGKTDDDTTIPQNIVTVDFLPLPSIWQPAVCLVLQWKVKNFEQIYAAIDNKRKYRETDGRKNVNKPKGENFRCTHTRIQHRQWGKC